MRIHRVKRIIEIIAVLVCCMVFFVSCTTKNRNDKNYALKETKSYQDAFHAFDTECTVTLYGSFDENDAKKYFSEIKDTVDRYEKMFSRTDRESEVYKINHRDDHYIETYKEVADLFTVAKEMYEWSSGYFDVSAGALFGLWDVKNRKTLPKVEELSRVMPLSSNFEYDVDPDAFYDTDKVAEIEFLTDKVSEYDFGALVKGYASDEVKGVLHNHSDITAALINFGGNVCCYGELQDREDGMFNVGIYKPFSNGEIIEKVKVKNKYVITSGNYQRYFKVPGDERVYHHIINPKTGYPTDNGIDSVTIISANGLLGDYLSTACMILGEEYSKKLIDGCIKELDDKEIEAIFVYSDMRISRYPNKIKY